MNMRKFWLTLICLGCLGVVSFVVTLVHYALVEENPTAIGLVVALGALICVILGVAMTLISQNIMSRNNQTMLLANAQENSQLIALINKANAQALGMEAQAMHRISRLPAPQPPGQVITQENNELLVFDEGAFDLT